jgi:O-antigen/teichoic acid export membrane protein
VRPGEVAYSVSRGAFWLTMEKVAALLSSVAYSMLLLRWLGPRQFGIMTLALACVGFATVATGNFEMFLERYAAEYEARGLRRTMRRAHLLALGIKLGLGLVASAVLWFLTPWLARFFGVPQLLVLVPVLTVMVAFDGFSTTGRATLYGAQEFRWLSLLAVCFHLAKIVLVTILWWGRHSLFALALGLSGLAVALALAQAVVPLWIMRHARDSEPPAPERAWRGLLRSIFSYCVPLLGARITFMSGQNLSTVILGKLFGPGFLGYFKFAFQTIERFNDLANAVPSSLMPSLTNLVARGERARLRLIFDQAQRLIQALAFVLSFGLFVFARELALLIGGWPFVPAVPILRVLAMVPMARTAQQPLTMLFQALRRPGTVLVLSLVKFVTEFGVYFLLVIPLGVIGAAWANLAGAVVAFVVAMALLARMVPEGARERARAGLAALALLLPLLGITLLGDLLLHGVPRVLFHLALVPVAGVGVFALRLVRQEDLDKLADVQLERPWTLVMRGSMLQALGFFARLAGVRRAA